MEGHRSYLVNSYVVLIKLFWSKNVSDVPDVQDVPDLPDLPVSLMSLIANVPDVIDWLTAWVTAQQKYYVSKFSLILDPPL